jgi:hypothetical protein
MSYCSRACCQTTVLVSSASTRPVEVQRTAWKVMSILYSSSRIDMYLPSNSRIDMYLPGTI